MANIELLRDVLPKLSERDRKFGQDLIDNYNRWGSLTARQEPWVDKLITRAITPKQAPVNLGAMSKVIALFEQTSKRGNSAAVVLRQIDGLPDDIRINRAGANARVPGSFNVSTNERYGENLWFGRILENGDFQPSNHPTPPALLPLMRKFVADPIGEAIANGKLTSRCCFCRLPLEDGRSLAMGYGPKCAKTWKLPWGKIKQPEVFECQ